MAQEPVIIRNGVAVMDPNNSTGGIPNTLKVNSDGSINVDVTIGPSGTQDVNLKQVNGVTVLTGAGATGTGSERVTVAQDATTISGAAPGTAGTPSTNVVSVQGVAGGTAVPVSFTPSGTQAVSIADGSDVAEGAKADAAVTNPASSASVIALLKGWLTGLGTIADAAWASGSGTVIALLKTVATAALSPDPVQTYRSDIYAARITSNATTVVKSGAGTCVGFVINALGTTEVVTIYDALSATGNAVFVIGLTSRLAGDRISLDTAFGTGITYVTSGVSAADITPIYR